MNIRLRLVLIFMLVLVVLLVLGVYSASIYRQSMSETTKIWRHTRDELMMAYQANIAFEKQQMAWTNLMLRGQEPDKYYQYLSEFYARERETRTVINTLLYIESKEARHDHEPGRSYVEAVRKFQENYALLGRQYREALKIYNASDDPAFETDHYIWKAVENPSNLIDRMIEQIVGHHGIEIKLVNARVDAELTRLWISAALVLLLSMAALVWFIYYRIGQPLSTMTAVARYIRDGDIHRRVPNLSGDEFRVLGETLNSMLDRQEDVNRSLAEKVNELEDEIDRRQTVESTLAAKTDELQETNKELEAFSYTIAHDLRGPLRAITGFSQLLQHDLKGRIDPEHQDALNRVSAAGVRMADQIDHILELARISRNEINIEDVDLSNIAEEIVQEISDSDPERQVEIDIQPGIHARADARLLRVVLQNLLGNAWKYTRNEASPTIRFSAGEENGHTVYRVTDNGVGFNMDYAHKLFGTFERLHTADEFEGVGIGLASVQRAIRRHGGWVRGKGEPGEGAEFVFSLG
jgi:signal transduction histidine kinase